MKRFTFLSFLIALIIVSTTAIASAHESRFAFGMQDKMNGGDRRDDIQEKRAEFKEEFQQKRGEFKTQFDEFKREKVNRLIEIMNRRFLVAIDRLRSIADRIEARIEKIEDESNENMTEARGHLADARGHLTTAEEYLDFDRWSLKDYAEGDVNAERFADMREHFMKAKTAIKAARESLGKALQATGIVQRKKEDHPKENLD
jgi:hypothetical protein